jgi:hypothetical protein
MCWPRLIAISFCVPKIYFIHSSKSIINCIMLLPKSELAAVPVDSVFLTCSVCDFGTEINNLTIRGCSTQEETRVALSPCRPRGNAELQPL